VTELEPKSRCADAKSLQECSFSLSSIYFTYVPPTPPPPPHTRARPAPDHRTQMQVRSGIQMSSSTSSPPATEAADPLASDPVSSTVSQFSRVSRLHRSSALPLYRMCAHVLIGGAYTRYLLAWACWAMTQISISWHRVRTHLLQCAAVPRDPGGIQRM
jgi:hypothetical protein